MINVYCFSSANLTNIWAGIGASLWAVSEADSVQMEARKTKSLAMAAGSYGLLYCSATHAFTTPFRVKYEAKWTKIKDVWAETWWLPFGIKPLGSPHHQLTIDEMKKLLNVMKDKERITDVFLIGGTCAFTPSKIPIDDWALILEELAPDYPTADYWKKF